MDILAVPERESHARLLASLPADKQIEAARLVREKLDAEGRVKPLTTDFVDAVQAVAGRVECLPPSEDREIGENGPEESKCPTARRPPDFHYTDPMMVADLLGLVPYVRTDSLLDPCAGRNMVWYNAFACKDRHWCEIELDNDFFDWSNPVDWIVSNPPYHLLWGSSAELVGKGWR